MSRHNYRLTVSPVLEGLGKKDGRNEKEKEGGRGREGEREGGREGRREREGGREGRREKEGEGGRGRYLLHLIVGLINSSLL